MQTSNKHTSKYSFRLAHKNIKNETWAITITLVVVFWRIFIDNRTDEVSEGIEAYGIILCPSWLLRTSDHLDPGANPMKQIEYKNKIYYHFMANDKAPYSQNVFVASRHLKRLKNTDLS